MRTRKETENVLFGTITSGLNLRGEKNKEVRECAIEILDFLQEEGNLNIPPVPETEWLNIEDEVPEQGVKVLWYDAMFNKVHAFALDYPEMHDGDYTHWMPLPDPPTTYQG